MPSNPMYQWEEKQSEYTVGDQYSQNPDSRVRVSRDQHSENQTSKVRRWGEVCTSVMGILFCEDQLHQFASSIIQLLPIVIDHFYLLHLKLCQ